MNSLKIKYLQGTAKLDFISGRIEYKKRIKELLKTNNLPSLAAMDFYRLRDICIRGITDQFIIERAQLDLNRPKRKQTSYPKK